MYRGRIIDPEDVAACRSPEEFTERLRRTLSSYREEGKGSASSIVRGVWLEVPKASVSSCLGSALDMGFELHHADKESVTLTYWLPGEDAGGETSTLPPHNTHTVGVGAVVLNDQGQMLAVQERSGPAAKLRHFWKVPTGLVEAGEDAYAACEREVLEETGVRVVAERLVALREAHAPPKKRGQSGGALCPSTNLFLVFTCRVRPGTSIAIRKQESEIAECRWMEPGAFLAAQAGVLPAGSLYSELNRATVAAAQQAAALTAAARHEEMESSEETGQGAAVPGFAHRDLPNGFRPGSGRVYLASATGPTEPQREEPGFSLPSKL